MADSLRASTQGLELIDKARRRKGWSKSSVTWYESAFTSKATLKRFWGREQIHRDSFIRICEAVGCKSWEDIVERYEIETAEPNFNFVGREEVITELNSIIKSGAKIIVIQGEGGVGKTKLARQYLKTQGFDFFLELWMATETRNIVVVESVVEEWLRRDFNEEPGRDLWINLQRLQRKLRDQTRRIGILIDNLEPALDKHGKFIESHRPYVELLRVLADPSVNSVTLITSRERLCEAGIEAELYLLKGLDESAWRQYFAFPGNKINSNTLILREMCRAYGGNAKAMQIIRGAVITDFESNMDAYWRATEQDLLIEPELENLVVSQFNRLQELDPETYRLLCRLGCYRYQDVPWIPFEGLSCLLWDVPEPQHRRVVNRLCDRSLVECRKGKYWLHPVILAEAVARLRISGEWEIANQKAGDFWTNSVNTIENPTDALKALESYYHYIAIEDFEQAADVIISQRRNKWGTNESLGRSFYKRGLFKPMCAAITRILAQVKPGYRQAKLYHTLGAICLLSGDIHEAAEHCEKSRQIALACLKLTPQEEKSNITKLKLIVINCLLTTGICQINLWELEEALGTFTEILKVCREVDYDKYAPSALFYLAFLYSHMERYPEAFEIAKYLEDRLPQEGMPSWVTEYRLSYLALTYKNLGEIEKSLQIYNKVISYGESSPCAHAKTNALSGIAQLYRQQGELTTALNYHHQAISTLGELGAKYDLAEGYYQLALTYEKMSDVAKSQENLAQALTLFTEMQAPRQVERVQAVINRFAR